MRTSLASIGITALVALAFIPPSGASETRIECPPAISVAQAVTSTPEGWLAYGTRDQHPFMAVSFSFGSPDQKASLAPSKEKKKGKSTIATWIFPRSDTDYWIACEYAGTTAVVAKALDRNTGVCTVEYDPGFSSPVAKSLNCYPVDSR